jgi:hypothetical protein
MPPDGETSMTKKHLKPAEKRAFEHLIISINGMKSMGYGRK